MAVSTLLGCAKASEPRRADASASPPPVSHRAPAQPSAPLSPLEQAKRNVTVHMPEHFQSAAELEEAIIAADLMAAKTSARGLLAHHPKSYPEPWAPFVLQMRVWAEEAAAADDLDAAALAAGEIVGSCGTCHDALGAKVKFPVEPAPPRSDEVTAIMRRHRWAAARLRAGVVEPSDPAWVEGIDGFGPLPTPVCAEDLGGERRVDVKEHRERFTALQEEARTVEALDARATMYGRLLATCAGCHAAGC